jgi:hypothetical protein
MWDEGDKKLSRIAAGTKISSSLSMAAGEDEGCVVTDQYHKKTQKAGARSLGLSRKCDSPS